MVDIQYIISAMWVDSCDVYVHINISTPVQHSTVHQLNFTRDKEGYNMISYGSCKRESIKILYQWIVTHPWNYLDRNTFTKPISYRILVFRVIILSPDYMHLIAWLQNMSMRAWWRSESVTSSALGSTVEDDLVQYFVSQIYKIPPSPYFAHHDRITSRVWFTVFMHRITQRISPYTQRTNILNWLFKIQYEKNVIGYF